MTQIYSDEEFIYRLSQSLNDVAEGRTIDAATLKKRAQRKW
jgi:hypothetical protein